MRVKQIGGQLFLDSGTLTLLLKRLELLGYVRRVREASDERQVTVSLTIEEHKLHKRATSIPTDLACKTHLSVEEAGELIDRIARLRTNLQAASGDALAPV